MTAHDDFQFSAARDANIDALGDVISHAFGFPRDDAKTFFERAGTENVRVLERGGRVCGGLWEVPMAQFFGGRSVTTMGVAGVGIVPEERGRGVATRLMIS